MDSGLSIHNLSTALASCHKTSVIGRHSFCTLDALISLAFARSRSPNTFLLECGCHATLQTTPTPSASFAGKPMRLKEGTHPSAPLPFALLLSGGSCLYLYPSLSFQTDLLTEIISSNSFAFQTTMTSSTHPPSPAVHFLHTNA